MFCTLGCSRMANVQGMGDERVQGIWDQTGIDSASLNGVKHHLKFTCDSFYMKLSVDARINYFSDTCATDGKRVEFAKGVYAVQNDTLMLSGVYTKSNFKQKISGCYNIGRYRHNFLMVENNGTELTIRDLSNNQTFILGLQEKIICEPKAL
ncbi:MAG: fumarate hydratase [Chitinophagaceae bacterium]|nr:MAG: fumarate hydratase [Chitinophagaceae bacterium]